MALENNSVIRLKSFELLRGLQAAHGDNIPRSALEKGFEYQGKGAVDWSPRYLQTKGVIRNPLSITTAPIVEGRPRPYEDSSADGFIIYRYRGTNPNHHENVGLRKAMETKTPLIHFRGVVPGIYSAVFPVYIVGDNPANLAFTVAVDTMDHAYSVGEPESLNEIQLRRRYVTVETQQRLHQAPFRYKVLTAYENRCSICRLGHKELLEAAHILPDNHPRGLPVVPNGISLCKIHHGAYDSNIIGITPDYSVEVNREVLEEVDGPMLLHGLQEFHKKRLILPHSKKDWPKPEYLDERYERFKAG
jgi:putative restriction endonuclease